MILTVPCWRCSQQLTLIINPKSDDDVRLKIAYRDGESAGRVKAVTLAAHEVDHGCPALGVTP